MSIAEQEHCFRISATTCWATARWSRCSRATISPTSWSMAPDRVFIEVAGKVQLTHIRFRDNAQLMNICQRIVSQVGRRVDETSPICDARLLDGCRVNVIAPPLSLDGPTLTIRKFRKDKLTLDDLVRFGSISPAAPACCVIGRSRCNVLISGGTGSGKTTLLNCMTAYIDVEERIITCEDAAELQLQQPHVVRLETRPPNLEGQGLITMRDLVRNCLRMRPERIIVGEVRGPEAFDLLQAMNTGHDGSMGTLHANSPREAMGRLESMITMGGFSLPMKTIREMIVGSIDVIIQAERLRDGSRRITKVTEVVGTEGEVVITQDLIIYEITGEDETGRMQGQACRHRHRAPHFLGTRPLFRSGARTGRGARQGQPMILHARHHVRARALAAVAFAFTGGDGRSKKRVAAVASRRPAPRWRASLRRKQCPAAQERPLPAEGHRKAPRRNKNSPPCAGGSSRRAFQDAAHFLDFSGFWPAWPRCLPFHASGCW